MKHPKPPAKPHPPASSKIKNRDSLAALVLSQQANVRTGTSLLILESHASSIVLMHDVAKEIASVNAELFCKRKKNKRENESPDEWTFSPSHAGERVLNISLIDFEQIRADYSLCRFSPLQLFFEEFFKRFSNFRLDLQRLGSWKGIPETELQSVLSLGENLRQHIRSKFMKNAQADFRRVANENFEGLIKSFKWLSQRQPMANVLRFDLLLPDQWWRETRAKVKQSVAAETEVGGQPDAGPKANAKIKADREIERLKKLLEEWMSNRTEFHRLLVRRLGGGLWGYAWTFKYSRANQFRIEYLMFVDPEKFPDHDELIKSFGITWANVNAHQKSEVHNCHVHSQLYPYRPLDPVPIGKPLQVRELQLIAADMTLDSLFVKLELPGNWHTFGKGKFPKADMPKVGRPPRHANRAEIEVLVSDVLLRARRLG